MFRKKLHASGGKLPAISAITFNQEGYIQLEIYNTQGSFNIHEFYFFHRMSMARHPKRAVNIPRCYRSSAISDAHCLFWVWRWLFLPLDFSSKTFLWTWKLHNLMASKPLYMKSIIPTSPLLPRWPLTNESGLLLFFDNNSHSWTDGSFCTILR